MFKFLKVIGVIMLLFWAALDANFFAQSTRRGPVTRLSKVKQPDLAKKNQALQLNVRAGRVLHVEGVYIVVAMNHFQMQQNVDIQYYVCDVLMRPVAFLEGTYLYHKNCKVFKITEGKVAVDDIVMLRQVPIKDEEESE